MYITYIWTAFLCLYWCHRLTFINCMFVKFIKFICESSKKCFTSKSVKIAILSYEFFVEQIRWSFFQFFCELSVISFNSTLIESAISSRLFITTKKNFVLFENIVFENLNTWISFHVMIKFVQLINKLQFCNQNKFKLTSYFEKSVVIISTFEIHDVWQKFY